MADKGNRAVIYARYSTDMQNPMSVRDQVAQCRRRAVDRGLTVVEEFLDEAQSATSLNRSAYTRLFEKLPDKAFDIILAESWDRLVRDQEDGARLYKHSDHYGITIHVLDRGDVGLMDASISSLVAAMFLEGLAHKTRRGLSGKVSEGKSGGGLSYGYRVARDKSGAPIKGELEIDQTQANVIRRIFQAYANGVSPLKIATSLNDDAVLSPRSRLGKGGHWKQNAINGNRARGTGILNNELYIGQRVWNRLRYSKDPTTRNRISRLNDESEWIRKDVPHLRIIDDELWAAVKERQDSLTKKRDTSKSKDGNFLAQTQAVRRQKYLLSGLLECGQCGGKLTIAGSDGRRRYYCANYKEKGVSVCFGFKGIRQSVIEPLVLSALRNELLKDEAYALFKTAFEAQLNSQSSEHRTRVVEIDKEGRDLSARLDKLIATIEAGGHSETIVARIKEIEQRRGELTKARNALTANHISLPRNLPKLYRTYVDELAKTLSNEEVVGRAAYEMRHLIKTLTVNYDGAKDEHTIEVRGDITAMFGGANPSEADSYQQSESSIKLVAGGRNRRSLRAVPQNAKTSAAVPAENSQLSLVGDSKPTISAASGERSAAAGSVEMSAASCKGPSSLLQPWQLQSRKPSSPVHMGRTCELPNRLISLVLLSDPAESRPRWLSTPLFCFRTLRAHRCLGFPSTERDRGTHVSTRRFRQRASPTQSVPHPEDAPLRRAGHACRLWRPRNEGRIMTPPSGQQWRTVLSEMRLEIRIERHVGAVVVDQVELDFLCFGPRHVGDVEFVSIRRKKLGVGSGAVLPGPDRVGGQ